jgi:RNA polymerase sigma-70 factor (ECF subfamily)
MSQPVDAEFVRELTNAQPWLRAFARVLLLNPDDADEVVQRTNMVLWQKAGHFEKGTNFRAWAAQVARLEILAYRREGRRDRLVFSDRLAQTLTDEVEQQLQASDYMPKALQACLSELRPAHRQLIAERYAAGGSVREIAGRQGRTADAVSAMLYRIRNALQKCIRRRLAIEQGGSHG